jgi:hypothetical protein
MGKNVGASAGALALLAMLLHVSTAGRREAVPSSVERTYQSGEKSTAASSARRSGAESASSNGEYVEGPWLATRPFFQHEPRQNVTAENGEVVNLFDEESVVRCTASGACRASLRAYFGASESPGALEFLIADIPDPLHTRLALNTDAAINAIEEGAASAGWEFASQWLPWNDTASGEGGDVEKRRKQRALVREQEAQPGILIFRHQKQGVTFDDKALLVFVLAEAPTSGVNPTQYKLARAYMKAFGSPEPVRILGPTFSGSFYSLAKLIDWDKQQFKTGSTDFVVRSGTATSNENANAFKQAAPDFDSTNQSLVDQQLHFCDVLNELGIPPSSAAYMVEAETGYGNSFSATASPGRRGGGCQNIKVFRFPREISHLRNAYREAVAATQAPNAQAPDVSFSLKDSNSGEDSVPVFSGTQTPLSQNAVLGEITSQIRRDGIRIVEAGASNVLDLLFLSRVLKEECPDTRVLVAFPDLLFVQAVQSEQVTGILSLSTYPLFFARELWAHDRRPAVTYTDMNSEGVYNAILLLLARSSVKEDAGRARSMVADYGWDKVRHPPTWFMALDRQGFAPINVFTTTRNPEWFQPVDNAIPAPKLPGPGPGWRVLAGLIAVFSVSFTGLVVYRRSSPGNRGFEFLAPDRGWAVDSARLYFLYLCLMLLVTFQVVLYLPWAFRPVTRSSLDIQILVWLGILCPAILAAFLGISLLRKPGLRLVRSGVLAGALVCALCIGLWWWCCYGGAEQSFFLSFRSMELRPGISPAIPVLAVLAAFFVFAVVHLMRFHLITNQRPRLFTTTFDAVLEGQLKKSRCEMNRVLLAPVGLWRPRYAVATVLFLLAALVACLLLRVDLHLATIDGKVFDGLIIWLQVSLVLTLIVTCWHIKSIWSWFHAFLTSLNSLPLARAFTQVDDGARRGPIWARHLNLLSLDIPLRSNQILHDMRILIHKQSDAAPGVRPMDVDQWYSNYRSALKKLLGREGGSTSDQEPGSGLTARMDFVRLKHVGALITDEICRTILLPHWRENCVLAEACDEDPKKTKQDEEAEGSDETTRTPGPKTFYDLSQSFVALHYSAFALYGVRQIQNLLWFLSLGFVLLTISMTSYTYQSPRLIGRFLFVLFAVLSYVSWRSMAEMERNTILSRIAGSTEGKLNKGFYLRLMSYGALPVLGILASQFPAISKFLFSWVQPALEALR